ESICIPLAVATLDRYVQTLAITELPKAVVKSSDCGRIGRAGIQYADQRELSLLLGVSGERPRSCRACEQCDELAPLHYQPKLRRWHLSDSYYVHSPIGNSTNTSQPGPGTRA